MSSNKCPINTFVLDFIIENRCIYPILQKSEDIMLRKYVYVQNVKKNEDIENDFFAYVQMTKNIRNCFT